VVCSAAIINTNINFWYEELFEDEKYVPVINKTAIILLWSFHLNYVIINSDTEVFNNYYI
jgi:hypothetical protein